MLKSDFSEDIEYKFISECISSVLVVTKAELGVEGSECECYDEFCRLISSILQAEKDKRLYAKIQSGAERELEDLIGTATDPEQKALFEELYQDMKCSELQDLKMGRRHHYGVGHASSSLRAGAESCVRVRNLVVKKDIKAQNVCDCEKKITPVICRFIEDIRKCSLDSKVSIEVVKLLSSSFFGVLGDLFGRKLKLCDLAGQYSLSDGDFSNAQEGDDILGTGFVDVQCEELGRSCSTNSNWIG